MKGVRPNESEHPVFGLTTGSGTLPTLYPTPCLQMTIASTSEGYSGEIERLNSHLTPLPHSPTINMKHSGPGSLSKQYKRLRNQVSLENPNIPDRTLGTRSEDTYKAVANIIKEQDFGTDVVRDDQTDMVDRSASELFSRALSLHSRPAPRSQSESRFQTIAIPMETTAPHDTPLTENSRSRLLVDISAITTSMLTVGSHEILSDDEVHIRGSSMGALFISDRDVKPLPSNNSSHRSCLGGS